MQNDHPIDLVGQSAAQVPAANLQYYSAQEEQGVHLRDYWHVLIKRKWWFVSVFLTIMTLTAAVTFLMPPIYMGKTTLQIIQDNPSAILGGSNADPLGALTGTSEIDRFYETQYKILQSPTLAYSLIDSLKLMDHPSYKKMEADNPKDSPEVIRQKYAQDLLLNLKVDPTKNSFLVDIAFRSTDKVLAQKVPQAIQREYLKLSMANRQQSYVMLKEWLDGELSRLGKKLEISEQTVYADGLKRDNLSMEDNQYNIIVQKYVELSKALTAAQADKTVKESQYRQVTEKGSDAPLIINNPLVQQLRQQLALIESQAAGSGTIFGSKFPERQAEVAKVKDLRDRLDHEVKRLQNSIRADYETSARTEGLLKKEFDQQKAKMVEMQNDLVQHHVLTRDLQTNQALYEALLARMKEASIASTMVASNVSTITAAETPYEPWLPRPLLFLALAAVIGCMAGILTSFFVEYLDNSIKDVEEMEKVCRIPMLGMVPMADAKELGKQDGPPELISHYDPMSMIGESIFHIRTALMLSASESPPRVIVVTSANPAEGKTTTTTNIAISFAASDQRCLLIDCDVRKPRLHKVFKLSNQCGLTNYLTGGARLEEIVSNTEVPNLSIITAGPTPPNPNGLFVSAAFRNMVESFRNEYDHIVIDSPPIIGFADARSLSVNADGTVLVFRHHNTTRDAARLSVQLLAQNNARIIGGILTMARKDRMGYGGYYGYYHYYNKYYKDYRSEGGETLKKKRKLLE